MKKNKNGFMLAELIITSTVVVVSMIGLYSSFSRIYSKYKVKNSYYSVDGIYATKAMTDYLLDHNFNDFINTSLESGHIRYLIKDGSCMLENEDGICESILELYHINNMIFSEYDECILQPLKCKNSTGNSGAAITVDDAFVLDNETFREYIDYVINYYDIHSSQNQYSYIILTEIEENNTVYYSNVRIR